MEVGEGCCFLLQGIFPAQGSNPGLLHWQVGSLPLNQQGSQAAFCLKVWAVALGLPASLLFSVAQLVLQAGKQPIWFTSRYMIFQSPQLEFCNLTISSLLLCLKQKQRLEVS